MLSIFFGLKLVIAFLIVQLELESQQNLVVNFCAVLGMEHNISS